MRNIVWIILLLTAGIGGYFGLQSPEVEKIGTGEPQDFEQPVSIKGMEIYEYNQDKMSWRFKIKKAELFEKKKLTFLTALSGYVYAGGNEKEIVEIKASEGVFDDQTQNIQLKKNIHISISDGGYLRTEYLVLDLRGEKIFNHHKVNMVSQGRTVTGDNLKYDIRTGLLEMKSVSMVFQYE